jgi:hypothetical protein
MPMIGRSIVRNSSPLSASSPTWFQPPPAIPRSQQGPGCYSRRRLKAGGDSLGTPTATLNS